jgi:hypothetical protein
MGTLLEDELPAGRLAGVDLRAGDVARAARSGVNWIGGTRSPGFFASVLIVRVFARPGRPFHQEVPVGEQRDQELIDHLLLPDDGRGRCAS